MLESVLPTIVNIRDLPPHWPSTTIYIGRANPRLRLAASPWANPYAIGRDGTREQVLAAYEAHLLARPDLLAKLPDLLGKQLACWCHPLPCHGDVLVRVLRERIMTGAAATVG